MTKRILAAQGNNDSYLHTSWCLVHPLVHNCMPSMLKWQTTETVGSLVWPPCPFHIDAKGRGSQTIESSKQPPRKFSGVLLSFALCVTGTYRLRFLAGRTEGAERTGCWTPSVNAHVRGWWSTASAWAALCNKLLKDFYQKRTKTSLHKKIYKKKSTPCKDGSMHEYTG